MREEKPPTNIPELRRFMGMINQFGKFSPNLAELTQPLQELLSKKQSGLTTGTSVCEGQERTLSTDRTFSL